MNEGRRARWRERGEENGREPSHEQDNRQAHWRHEPTHLGWPAAREHLVPHTPTSLRVMGPNREMQGVGSIHKISLPPLQTNPCGSEPADKPPQLKSGQGNFTDSRAGRQPRPAEMRPWQTSGSTLPGLSQTGEGFLLTFGTGPLSQGWGGPKSAD